MTKTKQEIGDLIGSWRSDRGWDLEDSEGFEDHREELLAVRRKIEAEEDARAAKQREADIGRLMKRAIDILPSNPGENEIGQPISQLQGSTVNTFLHMVAEMLLPLEQALARQADDIERLQERDR